MSNYTKATNFTAKDTLPTGNAGKIIKGTEIDVEFSAIASAISSKADTQSPTFTGTPATPTASSGTNTTQIASTAFVTSAVTAERSETATLTNKTISGASNTITNLNASNLASGTVASARLSGTYAIDISGNAATATTAVSTSSNIGSIQVFTSSGTFTVPTGIT